MERGGEDAEPSRASPGRGVPGRASHSVTFGRIVSTKVGWPGTRFAPHVVVDTSDNPPSQNILSRANSYASGSQPRGHDLKWGRVGKH